MSYYTQGIHNKQINPTTNSTNFRTEFRLNDPSTIYLTDMRLCNVGFSTESTPKSINECCIRPSFKLSTLFRI